jgi:hypothetical protein
VSQQKIPVGVRGVPRCFALVKHFGGKQIINYRYWIFRGGAHDPPTGQALVIAGSGILICPAFFYKKQLQKSTLDKLQGDNVLQKSGWQKMTLLPMLCLKEKQEEAVVSLPMQNCLLFSFFVPG